MANREDKKFSILVSDSVDSVSSQSFKLAFLNNLSVVGLVDNSEKTVNAVRKLRPDIVYIGYDLKPQNGIVTGELIKSLYKDTKVILNVESGKPILITRALNVGVRGICLRNTSPDRLKVGIECVAKGEVWIDECMLKTFVNFRFSTIADTGDNISAANLALSEREIEILSLVAAGCTNQKISEKLSISLETVKSHIFRIKARLNAADRTEAAVIAVRAKLV